MNNSWIKKRTKAFEDRLENFIKFSENSANTDDKIPCPCMECCNLYILTIEKVRGHVFFKGLIQIIKDGFRTEMNYKDQ